MSGIHRHSACIFDGGISFHEVLLKLALQMKRVHECGECASDRARPDGCTFIIWPVMRR